jgi:hypothetical protein
LSHRFAKGSGPTLAQSAGRGRIVSAPPNCCRGSFPPLVKKDPHHRRGSLFRSRRGSYPHRGQTLATVASGRETASHRAASARDNWTGNRQRDPPARTANLPRLAARCLFPAYRKRRPPPSPSFHGRVNNFENFPRLTGPARQSRRSASKPGAAFPKAAERVVKLDQTWGKPEKAAELLEKIKAQPAVPKLR